jgi:ABC-type multidrug transport system ATPase subunit
MGDFRKRRDLRRRIGIVQDTPIHVEDLTGLENGLLFAELYGLPRAEALSAFSALSTSLGLDDALDVPTREYSYGMKKKLLIAEALVHDPEMLILDEPALGLDPPTRVALLRMLEERSERGVCTLVATNEPELAKKLATTVVLLHEGEVVAHGSPAELLAKVGGATRIEVHVTGSPPADLGLPADIVSIQLRPGRIIAESRSGPDVLPQLVGAVLATGLKIERIELREPDLTDVFMLYTGQALNPEALNRPLEGDSSP